MKSEVSMDIFVERLRQAMFLTGMRQKDICERTGFSDSQMSNWHKGRYRPNAEAMVKIAKALGVTVDYLLGKEEIPIAEMTKPRFHEIPVLGSVAAGYPKTAQEDIIGSVYTDKNVFALRIKGDSMSPRIMDGDIVLVRRQDYAEDGDLVIAMIEDEATCKVFRKQHNTISLLPFNQIYAPLFYTETDDLKIIGKVVESRHEWE